MADSDLMTPREVAERFGVEVKTITRWAQAGKLTCFRTLGGHRRYNRAEVEKIIEESTEGINP